MQHRQIQLCLSDNIRAGVVSGTKMVNQSFREDMCGTLAYKCPAVREIAEILETKGQLTKNDGIESVRERDA